MLPKEKLKYLRRSQSSKMFMKLGLGGYAKPLKKDGRKAERGVPLSHRKNGGL
jgi:hypothetical protein